MRFIALFFTAAFGLATASSAAAQVPDGAAVFQKSCASCHLQPPPTSRAPDREALAQFAPESILTALTSGNMFRQGSELTDAERRAVAGFVAGRPVGTAPSPSTAGRCTAAPPRLTDAALNSGWNGWGGTVANTRSQPASKGGLTAPAVPKLKLKWAFGFAGVTSARAQPAVAGDQLFVGSENGDLYSLNAKTGCTYWSFHAQAGIRSAVSIGRTTASGSGFAVYFSDGAAVAYGVDAATGRQLWARKVDDHPYAKPTGSPTLYNGRLYIPMAGVGEEGQGGREKYECCTFRGSVTALDANTGAVIWKTYTIADAPKPRGKNAQGVQLWGPAGAGVWSAPTVDVKRGALYIATGNSYADPPQPTADAVIALDLATGKVRWVTQPVSNNDVFSGGCKATNPENSNCPATLGPDHDFSMSPLLATRSNGQDVLIVQSKSGMAYAMDADKGTVVWQYRTSAGSGMGGQWGAAVEGSRVFFGVNGTLAKTQGGMRAVKVDSGEEVWSKEAVEKLCGTARGCTAAQGAALTAVPGIVFSGSSDGGLRAYAADDGQILWDFDTNKEFATVNQVKAKGGTMDGPGAVVAGSMLYINSGYVSLIGRPGNVLLAFSVDEK
jgi:polyvinyl alcohol dehydrogenase (cytochrome)